MANWLQARIIINVECFNAGSIPPMAGTVCRVSVCVWGGGVWVCVCESVGVRACVSKELEQLGAWYEHHEAMTN